ncbi:MAG: N-acetylmuramoyl-L-alanine amidase [Opitutales bacterium]|nr:N-acetylmuramoyl-L-alanine amidase [Opitutales bacterium]
MPEPRIQSLEALGGRGPSSIVLHWTGGNYTPGAADDDYHYIVFGTGTFRIRSENRNVSANLDGVSATNAQHTRRFNSNAVGFCFAGAVGTTIRSSWNGGNPGNSPLKERQVKKGLRFVAKMCLRWGKHPLETREHTYNLGGDALSPESIRLTRRHPILLTHAEVNHLPGVPQRGKIDICLLDFRFDLKDYNHHFENQTVSNPVFRDEALDIERLGWGRHHVSERYEGGRHRYAAERAIPTWQDVFGNDEHGHWLRFETYWYYIRLQRGEMLERVESFIDNPAESIAGGLRAVVKAIRSPSSWMNRERLEEFREHWQAAAENASRYVEPELTDHWSVLEVRLQDADGEPVEGAKVLFIYDEEEVYVVESEADGYARPGMIQHSPGTEIFIVVPEYREDPDDPNLGAARRWSSEHHHWGPWPMPLSSDRVDAIRDLSKSDVLDWDSVDDVEVTGEGLDADTVKHYMPTHGLLHVPIQARVPVIELGERYDEE